MKILITGGAGFIGVRTGNELVEAGHDVRILDCLDPQIHGVDADFPAALDHRVEKLKGDVCRLEDCLASLDGVDAVIHLAARTGVGQSMYDIADYVETNVRGTATLLEAVVKADVRLKRVVLSSSRAIYGEGLYRCANHGVFHPDVRAREALERADFGVHCPDCGAVAEAVATTEACDSKPLSAYALTKKHQEDLLRWAGSVFEIPFVILRYFNVYGAGQSLKNPYTGVVSIFYSLLKAGRELSLYELGLPIRDFVHVSDVARANRLAIEGESCVGKSFNVGSGCRHSIAQIAQALQEAAGVTLPMEARGEYRVGDIFGCYADLSCSKQLLGYRPTVNLEAGMQEFVRWASGEEAVDLYDKTVRELESHGLFGRARAGKPG